MKKNFNGVRCPKCNGNIFSNSNNRSMTGQQDDSTGWCLQCGYVMYSNRDRILAEELASVSTDLNNS